MAAKKKELLEQEPAVIGTENSEATDSGAILLGEMADRTDAPAAAGEIESELDELLSDMGPDSAGNAIPRSSDDELSCETADWEDNGIEVTGVNDGASDPSPSTSPKRAVRKESGTRSTKAVEQSDTMEGSVTSSFITEASKDETEALTAEIAEFTEDLAEGREPVPASSPPISRRASRGRPAAETPVLTIEIRSEVETAERRGDVIWHEVRSAYRTRRILMGQLCGIEQADFGKTIIIADYEGSRTVTPLKEMMIQVGRSPSGQAYADSMLRQSKILNNMLGTHIDLVVRGADSRAHSVVTSRQETMLKKRQILYLDNDSASTYRIYKGRIVQARIIVVAKKAIRVETFGVECSTTTRDLAWDRVGDAHERFSVGDEALVRVLGVRRDSLEEISVKVNIKGVTQNNNSENLKRCWIQSKYTGKIAGVHKGVVYTRLSNEVNAVAHSYCDQRMPGKKNDVSSAVTRTDEEHGVAVGIIARVIRQNLRFVPMAEYWHRSAQYWRSSTILP